MRTAGREGGVLLVSGEASVSEAAGFATRLLLDWTQGELTGVFVEDARLLDAASMPFTREVGRLSGLVRSFERADLERLMRARAKSFRAECAAMAAGLQRPWSFEQCRGDAVTRALDAMEHSGAVIVAPAGRQARKRTGADSRSVNVIVPDRPSEAGAVVAASQLGTASGYPVKTYVVPTSAGEAEGADAPGREAAVLSDCLRAGGAHASVVIVSAVLLPTSIHECAVLLRDIAGVLVLVAESPEPLRHRHGALAVG